MFPSREDLHEAKRQAVLRQAATSFNARGFHATSLADVAAGLGVTKAALYHYFPNKNALLAACFDHAMALCFACLDKGRAEGRNGRERLLLTLSGYIAQIIDDLSCAVVLLEEGALEADDYAKVIAERDRFEKALRGLVREGVKDGSIVPCDPKLVVFIMLGALNWVPKWYRPGGRWKPEQIAAALAEVFDRTLSSTPAAAMTTEVARISGRRAKARAAEPPAPASDPPDPGPPKRRGTRARTNGAAKAR
ncbi:TetR/AcrR family transcriptional regulator [Enterovirga rhinocerotis]|uniref:TetR family transcriptional regulator n=1 Tax=Enterovirga rhinocerotis TaxID=1339210 RepID=A0A4R7C1Y0_9HYPH|nr:TetR/AcrR family transcriptional regulator [Enterovirga rhinocerotis]TDR90416.1 TetR family transcriptional regulator [Enterovirga rhinocerotis]